MYDPYVHDDLVDVLVDQTGTLFIDGARVETIRFVESEVTTRVLLYANKKCYFLSKAKYDSLTAAPYPPLSARERA